ncbi:MAG TPA: rod shape-determining protein MreD [Actinomycetes bacterium]|nr:rod shape-determining protein MreD [Actinomycetes bacterium]
MTVSRVLLTAMLLISAAVVQVTVINPLPLPGDGPDLVLLVLIGLTIVSGPLAGAITGFAAGLLVDLMPPAAAEVGRWALVFCLVGYLAGHIRMDDRRSPWIVLAAVGGLSAFAVTVYSAIGLLFSDQRLTAELFVTALVGTVLYDLLLAPFVIPVVMSLAKRTETNPSRL